MDCGDCVTARSFYIQPNNVEAECGRRWGLHHCLRGSELSRKAGAGGFLSQQAISYGGDGAEFCTGTSLCSLLAPWCRNYQHLQITNNMIDPNAKMFRSTTTYEILSHVPQICRWTSAAAQYCGVQPSVFQNMKLNFYFHRVLF